jgi:hypothetical protein
MVNETNNLEKEVQESFLRILVEDVIISTERHDIDPTQANKRDLIRTIFAAIEGLSWSYREKVRSVANDIDPLSPIQKLALAEKTYSVDEQGKIQAQTRFISIPAMIRLTTRLVEQFCPALKVDFDVAGWADLKQAIKVRNRITHPKSLSDLDVSSADVAFSQSGLFWFLGLVGDVMAVMLSAQTEYLADFRHLTNLLASGDETALAEYRAVLTAQQD